MSRRLPCPDWPGVTVTAPGLAKGSTGSCAVAAPAAQSKARTAAAAMRAGSRVLGTRNRWEIIRFLPGSRPDHIGEPRLQSTGRDCRVTIHQHVKSRFVKGAKSDAMKRG